MEAPNRRPFPDLEEGIYFFSGGYLIIHEGSFQFLRHDNDRNNLEHLHKKYKIRGKLPEKYLELVQLPESAINMATYQIRGLIQKNIRDQSSSLFEV